jgi:hypothetical protein
MKTQRGRMELLLCTESDRVVNVKRQKGLGLQKSAGWRRVGLPPPVYTDFPQAPFPVLDDKGDVLLLVEKRHLSHGNSIS